MYQLADDILAWLNTIDENTIDKSDVYKFVMNWKPTVVKHNDRGLSFRVGDEVSFMYPVQSVRAGRITRINGEYISIAIVLPNGNSADVERYPNEIVDVL